MGFVGFFPPLAIECLIAPGDGFVGFFPPLAIECLMADTSDVGNSAIFSEVTERQKGLSPRRTGSLLRRKGFEPTRWLQEAPDFGVNIATLGERLCG